MLPSRAQKLNAELAELLNIPPRLEENLFARADAPVYTASNPIPIDPGMPEGLVFKVQVGAFRNPIPQDLFGNFAPIMGERLNSGITRYTVGLFTEYPEANFAKQEVRGIGYNDAFVVAFLDGERISLNQALAQTGDNLADVASSVVRNVETGGASIATTTSVDTGTTDNNPTTPTTTDSDNTSVDTQPEVDLPASIASASEVTAADGLFLYRSGRILQPSSGCRSVAKHCSAQ